ncbi:MAG: Sir2 family NAD-dependent protein deacetylase [Sandaracinaceae bacterium]
MRALDLRSARKVVVLTGAGVSVASGLRPYRGPGGLWTEQPELAARMTAGAAPDDLWRLFGPLRGELARAEPNAAHRALAALEARVPLTVITQNIDGLHQRAGSQSVVELHGALGRSRCVACDRVTEDLVPHVTAPRCECGGALRPDVVLFEEPLPVDAEYAAKRALRDCDLFLAIGTSGTVSPASNFVRSAAYEGAHTVYVNLTPMDPPNPAFRQTVLGRAEDVLPALLGVE